MSEVESRRKLSALPSWDAVRQDYIDQGLPAQLVIRTTPKAALFVETGAHRLGARFAISANERPKLNPLAAITVGIIIIAGERLIEIATSKQALFRNFYLMLSDILSDVTIRDADVSVSIAESLARWQELLRESALLPHERQSGLFGELWLLRRLIEVSGPSAIHSWTGPQREAHDFRMSTIELEVKTTSGERRVHMVNGLEQLCPSQDCTLFIVSLRLIDAGQGGQTLPEAIDAVRALLAKNQTERDRFENCLELLGYDNAHSEDYTHRFRLADAPLLIPVIQGTPRLTTPALGLLPQEFGTDRIVSVSYRIDVTGLGFDDGTPEFLAILPAPQSPGAEPSR